jgi:hypothetical protein
MMFAAIVIGWFPVIAVCAVACNVLARAKGRGGLPWAFAGYIFGPVALTWLVLLNRSNSARRTIADIRALTPDSVGEHEQRRAA